MGMPIERRGAAQKVHVGSLYAGRTRTLYLTLEVPTQRLGAVALGEVSLQYQQKGEAGFVSVGALPAMTCLNDRARFEEQINRGIWERAMLEDVLTTTQEQFGDAIRTGNRQHLKKASKLAQRERQLASKLGSKKVLSQLDSLKEEEQEAVVAQKAAPAVRNRAAKKSKARGYQKRNKSSYAAPKAALESY